jgi:hypothetical protein
LPRRLTIVTIADGPGRGGRPEFEDPVGVDQRHVVRPMVAVMRQPGQIPACSERSHVQRLQRQGVRVQGRGDVEANDPAREHIGNERDICEALPRPNVGVMRCSA